MDLTGYLCGGIVILTVALLFVGLSFLFGRRWGWHLEPLRILLGGVVASAVVLFIPLYTVALEDSGCGPLETFLISIHNTIRLFVVDGEFDFVYLNIVSDTNEAVFAWYTGLLAVLFVLAPLLTFGFAMTFFKNVAAYEQYLCNPRVDAYIFSELNEKSLALAKSLHEKDSRRLLVFTDVFDTGEEQEFELIGQAKKLGAICFKLDITAPIFKWHSKKSKLCFFTIIGEDYTENTRQALALVAKYRHRHNTELYVSSTQAETELLLNKAFSEQKGETTGIRVRRIDEVRSLVSRTLYEEGYEAIFVPAAEVGNKITAAIIGMGGHGTDMTKALAWFGQMDGYELEIHAFDRLPTAEERFSLACPELMEPFGYAACLPGKEEPYSIHVHSGVDVETKAFVETVLALKPTYVFVSLGNDEMNISTAVRLRELCERSGCHPYIHAIVYNTDKKKALEGITNFKGQAYDIHFIGDMYTTYSERVLFNNEVEQLALARHTKWGDESTFWQYSYNYQSSIASAIHARMKVKCGIPGIDKPAAQRTEAELWGIRKLEHRRWNAYMRSEGYVYGEKRNDLAKTHPCLVPFEALPPKEQEKDDD